MIRRFALTVVVLLIALTGLSGQTDPCTPGVTPYTVTSGAPYTVRWVIPALVPRSATDPTLVPLRVNGFYVQVDSGVKLDVGALAAGAPCPSGVNVGKLPFSYRTASGVTRGTHTVTVIGWNFALDATGSPTTLRQEGAPVSTPFVGVDPAASGPPPAVENLTVVK